jgi:hypothetical protein
VLIAFAFLAMLGFVAIIVQEISTLAQQIPEHHSNLEAKIRSLPGVIPGGGVLHRLTSMVQELGWGLTQSETQIAKSADDRSGIGSFPSPEPDTPWGRGDLRSGEPLSALVDETPSRPASRRKRSISGQGRLGRVGNGT